jgi:hypothetical protein
MDAGDAMDAIGKYRIHCTDFYGHALTYTFKKGNSFFFDRITGLRDFLDAGYVGCMKYKWP